MSWLLVPTSAGTPSPSSTALLAAYNNYTIENNRTGACLDSTGGGYGTPTAVVGCNGGANQTWQARPGSTTYSATTYFLFDAGTGAGAAPAGPQTSQQ